MYSAAVVENGFTTDCADILDSACGCVAMEMSDSWFALFLQVVERALSHTLVHHLEFTNPG